MALDERSFIDRSLKGEVEHAITDDDDTVPSEIIEGQRLGLDPLLVNPAEPSGMTGQIVRPGDQTPRWLVPLFSVGCAGFITLLLLISS